MATQQLRSISPLAAKRKGSNADAAPTAKKPSAGLSRASSTVGTTNTLDQFIKTAETASRSNENEIILAFAGKDGNNCKEVLEMSEQLMRHSDTSNSISRQCPMCLIDLSSYDEQSANTHVNRCLDGESEQSGKICTSVVTVAEKQEAAVTNTLQRVSTSTSWAAIFKKPEPPPVTAAMGIKSKVDKTDENTVNTTKVPRSCPFYKRMQGTQFTVDAFCYGRIPDCSAYFLTHFHADHYGGLSSTFDYGPIYCSPVTKNLVMERLHVNEAYLVAISPNIEVMVQGVGVTFMDANHCPGAVIILFRIPGQGHRSNANTYYLHMGDFRAHPCMLRHPALTFQQHTSIDHLYLDTTYLSPNYTFPAQERILQLVHDLAKSVANGNPVMIGRAIKRGGARAQKEPSKGIVPRIGNAIKSLFDMTSVKSEANSSREDVADEDEYDEGREFTTDHYKDDALNTPVEFNPDIHLPDVFVGGELASNRKVLFVVGTYLIGKEKVFLEVATAIDSKIYADNKKFRIFQCLEDDNIMRRYTNNRQEAQVHVVSIRNMNSDFLQSYLSSMKGYYTHLLALKPTGWTFRAPKTIQTGTSYGERYRPPTLRLSDLIPMYTSATVCIMGVPYSEHSSFYELSRFVSGLNVKRVLPTVNVGSEKSRTDMSKWLSEWHEAKRANGGIIPWDE